MLQCGYFCFFGCRGWVSVNVGKWVGAGGLAAYRANKVTRRAKVVVEPLGEVRNTSFWSSTRKRSSVENAFEHWKKHQKEFPELNNAKEYVESAKGFLNSNSKNILTKRRNNGEIIKYDPEKNLFGVTDKNGTPITFFKPDPSVHKYPSNLEYFYGQ